jgi:hypothetical protein
MKQLAWVAVFVAACGGSDGPVGGPPALGTTPKQWQYVPIDGAQCMNGTPTGIGVNLGTSGDLVIYLEGAGPASIAVRAVTLLTRQGGAPINSARTSRRTTGRA